MGDKIKLYEQFDKWREKGSIWLIGDTHFNDGESELFGWPSDEERVKIINSKVGKNDTLVILGDVGDPEIVKQLKGYKVLICGNHDKGVSNYKVKYWTEIYDADDNMWYECHKGADYKNTPHTCGKIIRQSKFMRVVSNGMFDEVYDGPLFISNKILLSHEPINLQFGVNIHGHCHAADNMIESIPGFKMSINLASDVCKYEPKKLNDLFALAKTVDIHRLTIDKR